MIIYSLSFNLDKSNVDGIVFSDDMTFVGKRDFCIDIYYGLLYFRLHPNPYIWYRHRWLNISPLECVTNRQFDEIPAGTKLSVLQYDQGYYVNIETNIYKSRYIDKSYIYFGGLFIDIGGKELMIL